VRFEVLGFAAGAAVQAACSSYLVTSDRTHLLLDCGPGALERLWRRGLLTRLDAVVLSHMHADHVLDVLSLASDAVTWLRGDERIALYVPAGDGRAVLGRLAAVFDPPGETRFDRALTVHEYDADDVLTIGDLSLRFAATDHPGSCLAARVTDGRAVAVYGADGAVSDATVALGRDADLLVLEATFVDDEEAAARYGHLTASQAGALATCAGARRLLLTHQLPGVAADAVAAHARATFAGPVDVAHEGLRLEL
jgi:ribonuclease BN (tRNA processing enzyme)